MTTAPPLLGLSPRSAAGVLRLIRPAPPQAGEARWLPLDELSAGQRWVDAQGQAQLWLEPRRPEVPCQISWGAELWRALDPRGPLSWSWTAAEPPPDRPPQVQGCAAQIRVEGEGLRGEAVVALHRLPWGQPLRYDLDPARAATLRLALPAGPRRGLELRWGWERWSVELRPAPAPEARSEEGGRWSVLALPLPPGAAQVELEGEGDLLASLAQPSPAAPAPAPPSSASPAELRQLSEEIGRLPLPDQAPLRRERARLLMAAGQLRSAARDLELAGGAEEVPWAQELRASTQRERARLLGAQGWWPADPRWLPGEAAEEQLRLAARRDWVGLARGAEPEADVRRWWLQAALEGQIFTAADRIAAFLALVTHSRPGELEHELLWPLRAPSAWEPLRRVQGGAVALREAQGGGGPAPWEALFPEAWPEQGRIRLREGAALRLPPGQSRLRCLALRAQAALEPCELAVEDLEGRELRRIQLDPAGLSQTLTAGDGAEWLALRGGEGLWVELLPGGGEAEAPMLRRWSLRPGAVAVVDLLGPTALQVEVGAAGAGEVGELEWRASSSSAPGRALALLAGATQVIPIPAEGPVRLRIRAGAPLKLGLSMRVAARLPQAVGLAATSPTPAALEASPLPGAEALVGPAPRPARRPAVTFMAGAGVGTAAPWPWSEGEGLEPALRERLGLAHQSERWPWWSEAQLSSWQLPGRGPLWGLGLGSEARLTQGSGQLWLLADGRLALAEELVGLELEGRLRLDQRLGPRWRLLGAVGAVGRPEPRPLEGGGALPAELWSSWRSEHPFGWGPQLELRWTPDPWLRLRLGGGWLSNPEPWSTEATWAELRGAVARPGAWWEAGLREEHRPADASRPAPWTSTELLTRGAWTFWPHSTLGLQLLAAASADLSAEEAQLWLGLTLYASPHRGLDDLRPSRNPLGWASAWGQLDAPGAQP